MEFLQNIKPREYQAKIFESCKEDNCLVVLPTGLGKTLIALMLAIHRSQKHPGEKIVFLAPTKPLAEQHLEYFKKHLPELFGDMQLFTGKVKSEKRKKIWQTADIVFSTPQCVSGDTLIFTKKGPVKISEFFKKFKFEERKRGYQKWKESKIDEKVLGFDGKKIMFLNASKALKLPKKEMVNIKTEIGNSINCTEDHPLLTINKSGEIYWKKASNLNEGEYIASPKEMNIKGEPLNILELISKREELKIADKYLTKDMLKRLRKKKINSSKYSRYYHNYMPLNLFQKLSKKTDMDFQNLTVTDNCGKSSKVKIPKKMDFKLAYIIGAMLGDGHLGDRKSHGGEVVFSDLDRKSVREKFSKTIKEVFGIDMKEERSKGLISYNSALTTILNRLGIPKGNKSKKLQIPCYMFFADKNSIKGFIKGIFDTDGSASNYTVSIASANNRFMQELKWLFLKIGILGSVEKGERRGEINNRKIKESEISIFRFSGRQNLEKFLEADPDQDKCKNLIRTLNNTKKPGTRSKEILPVPFLIKKIQKENRGKENPHKFRYHSVDNLKKLSNKLEGENNQRLKELIDMPIRWVKIKEKNKIPGKKETYDLTIENHHNFITNHLISHNCVANDIKKRMYDLNEVSLLIEDEAHRCVKNYDYNFLAKNYMENSEHPLILGMTASPGSDKKKIQQICENLSIKKVELRSRNSEDVKKYLQELEFEKIKTDLPEEFWQIRKSLKKILDKYIEELKNRRILFKPATKTNLIELQKQISSSLARGNKNFNYYQGASACAQAIKIQHAIELIETQTVRGLNNYLKKLFEQARDKKSKGIERLVSKPEFNFAYMQSNELLAKKREHPKIETLVNLVYEEKQKNPKTKIIVFTQFRDTASVISEKLNQLQNKGINSKVFVGQANKSAKKEDNSGSKGLSQKEQKRIIQEFSRGEFNVLTATSIAEEGLDIPEVNSVIFYEPIPSAIRSIQRKGRTARLMKGKLIMLITRKTRDESFFYVSKSREKKMESVIENIKEEMESEYKNKTNKESNNEKQKKLFN